jgi:hypothetical protein
VAKAPEGYIRQAEQALRPLTPGSLNIGTLRGQ